MSVEKQLERIEQKQDKQYESIMARFGAVDSRLNNLYDRQANGRTVDARTETRLDNHISSCDAHKKRQFRLMMLLVGTLLSGVITLLVTQLS